MGQRPNGSVLQHSVVNTVTIFLGLYDAKGSWLARRLLASIYKVRAPQISFRCHRNCCHIILASVSPNKRLNTTRAQFFERLANYIAPDISFVILRAIYRDVTDQSSPYVISNIRMIIEDKSDVI